MTRDVALVVARIARTHASRDLDPELAANQPKTGPTGVSEHLEGYKEQDSCRRYFRPSSATVARTSFGDNQQALTSATAERQLNANRYVARLLTLKTNRRRSLIHSSGLLPTPAVFAAVLICSLNTPAYSQEVAGSSQAAPDNKSAWIVTLGGSVEYGPSYPGSEHLSVSAMPSFDIRRLGEPAGYSAPDDNIDYSIVDFHGLELGPVVGFRDGRSTSDDQRLHGLEKIEWGLDAGGFAQYWLIEDRLRVRGEVRQALRTGDGLVADISLDWFQPISNNLVLSAGPRLSLANDAFMHRYFGISQRESAANGVLPAFDAQGGVKAVGITLAMTYTISPAWSVQVYDRYDRLTADAAASPITSDIGTRNQNIIGLAINHSFQVAF